MNPLCASCGAELVPNALFCGNCGADARAAAAAAPIATRPNDVDETSICSGCGVIAPIEQRGACKNCGESRPSIAVAAHVGGFWTAVKCRFRCTACGHHSPLDHLDFDGAVDCLRCGINQRFERDQWIEGIAQAHAVGDLAGPSEQGRFPTGAALSHNPFASIGRTHTFAEHEQSGVEIGGPGVVQHSLAVKAMPGHPLCPKCKTPMTVAATAGTLDVACPGCAHRARYQTPSTLLARVRGLGGVVADEHEQGGRDVKLLEDSGGAVAIRCPNCSAPLPVDGTRTVLHCGYCGIAARIPSSTLRRLGHENPEPELWWLYFTERSAKRAQLERRAERAQREAAEREARDQLRARQVAAASVSATPVSAARSGSKKRIHQSRNVAIGTLFAVGIFGAVVVMERWATSPAPARAPLAPVPVPPPKPSAPVGPLLALEWAGKVSSAQGKALAKNSPCRVALEARGPRVQWLRVSCGDERLYDSRTPLSGMSSHVHVIGEAPHEDHPGKLGYAIVYRDTGPRGGRSQLQLDTTHGQAIVFSETIPQFRVEIAVDTVSAPRGGKPLFDTPDRIVPVALDLRLESVTGSSEVTTGAKCRLELAFVNNQVGATTCRATLGCGRKWLYGKQDQPGFLACKLGSASTPISATDTQPPSADETPELSVEVERREVRLSSGEDGYQLVFRGGT